MIFSFGTLLVFYLILAFGVAIVAHSKNALMLRTFLLPFLGFLIWVSTRLFPLLQTSSNLTGDVYAELLYAFSLVGTLFLAFGLVVLAYVFPKRRLSWELLRSLLWGGVAILLGVSVGILATDFVVSEATVVDTKYAVTTGTWYGGYVLLLTALYVWMFITLGQSLQAGQNVNQVRFFMGSIFLGLLGLYLTDVLPLLFQTSALLPYWGFLTTALAGAIFVYAIIRHRLFNLKQASINLLLLGMGVALVWMTMASESLIVFGFNLLVLLIFGILAFFLIHELVEEHERKRKIRKANNRLSEAVDAKEQFLRLTSHQLRTPLKAIEGYMDMLLDAPTEEYAYPSSIRPYLEKAYLNYQRLDSIVEDISVANQISTGNLHLDPKESFDLRELLLDVCQYNSYFASEHDVNLTKTFPQKEVPFEGREKLLFEAFHNLLHNAIIYGSSSVQISLREKQNTVVIKFIDDGMGITEEEHDLLGQRFRRPKRAEERHPDGSGLGVYIAQTIIETHHGSLEFHSEGKENGSVVTVTLPTSS